MAQAKKQYEGYYLSGLKTITFYFSNLSLMWLKTGKENISISKTSVFSHQHIRLLYLVQSLNLICL